MDWTEETIVRLRGLWAEGHSTAEIGRRLGVTKNAVVGKAHRLDLPARPSPIRRDGTPGVQPRRPAPRRIAGPTLPPLSSSAPSPAPGPLAVAASVPGTPHVAVPASGIAPVMAPRPEMGQPQDLRPEPVRAEFGRSEAAPPAPSPFLSPALPHSEPAAARRPAPLPVAPAPVRVSSAPRPYARSLTCCWPIGEPGTRGFRFCDDGAVPGKPYCSQHAAVAYVKVRDRREDAA